MKSMRRFLQAIAILLFISALNPIFAQGSCLNSPRLLKIGLVSLGTPSSWSIEPSTGNIEIFDGRKKQALYTGKAEKIHIEKLKNQKMRIVIDGKKKYYFNSTELVFSAVGRPPINLVIRPDKRASQAYRGSIAIRVEPRGLMAINHVDVEDYLKSVVPSEIFNRAPDAAQEAQTVAARTYAFRNLNRHEKSGFNLCDKVHCQVYVGIKREIKLASKAVKATEGKVLTYEGTLANTVYHSNCGGNIIDSRAAWKGAEVPYLIGHYDGVKGEPPFCSYGHKIKRNKQTGPLPKPRKKLIIKRLRPHIKVKKHNNFGHRVGMCQDGAIGMAAIGYTSRHILAFYYPGTRIATMRYVVPKAPQKQQQKPMVLAMAPTQPKTVLQAPVNPTQISTLRLNRHTDDSRSSNLRSTLKKISGNKDESSSSLIRKMFWNPSQPEISRESSVF